MPYVGGKRKKSRTQKPLGPDAASEKVPRSMVLRRGKVDSTVIDLLFDLRKLMMPHTAAKLKEKKTNSLRDFVDVSAQLGVSHLMMLSQSERNIALRVARTPRGPTLTFRVDSFTLGRSVRAAQKRPVDVASAFDSPPLVVMHNFSNAGAEGVKPAGASGVSLADALKMTTATFQNMFPTIDPATIKLVDCRRVVLIHFNKVTQLIELRHYLIRAVPVGVSKGVKKISGVSSSKQLPDLSRLGDISEFLLGSATGAGGASDSEFEGAEADARVTLPQNYAGKGNAALQSSAIKLSEIGPRLSLSLVKIEQGLCQGEVLYHAFVTKSMDEAAQQRNALGAKEREKKRRRSEQEANVARKADEADAKKQAKAARIAAKQESAVASAAAGTLGDEEEEDEEGEEEKEGEEQQEGEEEDDEDDSDEEEAEGRPGRGSSPAASASAAPAEQDDDNDDDDEEDGDGEDGDGEEMGGSGSEGEGGREAEEDDDEEEESDAAGDDDDDAGDDDVAPAAAPGEAVGAGAKRKRLSWAPGTTTADKDTRGKVQPSRTSSFSRGRGGAGGQRGRGGGSRGGSRGRGGFGPRGRSSGPRGRGRFGAPGGGRKRGR